MSGEISPEQVNEDALITDLAGLAGKTIVSAKYVDFLCSIAVVFESGEWALLESDEGGDAVSLAAQAGDHLKHSVGVISSAQLAERRKALAENARDVRRRKEMADLERLKKKYES